MSYCKHGADQGVGCILCAIEHQTYEMKELVKPLIEEQERKKNKEVGLWIAKVWRRIMR